MDASASSGAARSDLHGQVALNLGNFATGGRLSAPLQAHGGGHNCLRIRINNTFEQNVIYDMRREVYACLQRLPVNYFDQRASGDLMTRVIEDVNAVERVLIDGTEQGSVAVVGIVGVIT